MPLFSPLCYLKAVMPGRKQRLSLLLCLLFFAAPLSVQAAPEDDVLERADAMYAALREKNVRHIEIRRIIRPYFLSDEEMSSFLIRLTRLISNKGITNNKIEEHSIEILDADTAYGFAETRASLEGDWLLWFNRGFEKIDRWKLVDDVWYVNPPPLENLEFEDE